MLWVFLGFISVLVIELIIHVLEDNEPETRRPRRSNYIRED